MERIPTAGDFRANFSLGGSVQIIDIDDETKKLALDAAESGFARNAGIDILIDQSGKKYILEINRSPGFKGFEAANDIDVAEKIIIDAINNAD